MRKLKKIGRVLHRTKAGSPVLICRVNGHVERNTEIFTGDLEKIGHLKEVFGPVDKPYAKIKVEKEYTDYQGELFVIED